MSKLSVLIVEDEPMIANFLKQLILEFSFEIEKIACEDTVSSAVNYIKVNNPNLLLLDVKLADGTSFEILNQIDTSNCKLIFITSHHEFAIDAFKYSAVNYLLKPINATDLEVTLIKASNELLKDQLLKIDALKHNVATSNSKIILNTLDELYILDVKDIIVCKSEGSYTQFFVKNSTPILVSKPIKYYVDLLEKNSSFFRVHKSFLINIEEIKKVNKKNGAIVIMKNDMEIPIAELRWKEFIKTVST